ncbi:MAG: hypothetical protein PUP93_10280 [Rhizonema sp. NSF051]|nr:hypothetical protein [Rhizonema sp. NSF051]
MLYNYELCDRKAINEAITAAKLIQSERDRAYALSALSLFHPWFDSRKIFNECFYKES